MTPPVDIRDPGEALAATVREPGAIWCFSVGHGLTDTVPPGSAPFRWVHLNLSDRRSLRWLEREAGLPPPLLAFIESTDTAQRHLALPKGLAFVLHDFERGLESDGIGEIAPLYVALVDGLFVTGRRRPLHGADLLRARLAAGAEVASPDDALGFLLGTLIDSFAALVRDLAAELLETETELLAQETAPDTRDLVLARRRSAQLHRLVGTTRSLLQRIEADPAVPRPTAAILRGLVPRLVDLDGEVVAAQQQLRQIREEIDLEAAQRTNQNVYLLSVLTALMAPATLVTGFFGMNTGGMPFAGEAHGTLMAFLIALMSAAGTYWLLRRMGLIRTR